jgi:TonB family C-terminal domain
MHAVYRSDLASVHDDATFSIVFPEKEERSVQPESPFIPSQLLRSQQHDVNWGAILFILAFHGALLVALIKMDVVALPKMKHGPTVVELVAEPPAPPPFSPEQKAQPEKPLVPSVTAPTPVVVMPPSPPPVMVAPEAPPPKAVIVSSTPSPVMAGPVSVSDLSSRMVFSPPPRFSVESRRKREGGVVHIRVLLGLDGGVMEASLAGTCGFERIDKAVLQAVRKWRWSPTLSAGKPVMVSGIVDVTVNPPA